MDEKTGVITITDNKFLDRELKESKQAIGREKERERERERARERERNIERYDRQCHYDKHKDNVIDYEYNAVLVIHMTMNVIMMIKTMFI